MFRFVAVCVFIASLLPIPSFATDLQVIASPFGARYSIAQLQASPDGQWLCFLAGSNEGSSADTIGLWIIDTNGDRLSPVLVKSQLGERQPQEPTWGFDSQSIYVGHTAPVWNEPREIWKLTNFLPLSSVSDDGGPSVIPLLVTSQNPAKTFGWISYTLPTPGPVSLALFNTEGRCVEQLVDGQFQVEGVHECYFRATTAGVYFLQLIANDRIATTKVVVVR